MMKTLILVLIISHVTFSEDYFTKRWESPSSFCSESDAEVFLGDFNHDGQTDMLCHQWYFGVLYPNGYKKISYSEKPYGFNGIDWEKDMKFCYHDWAGAQLFIMDYDGNGYSDMLCHDSATGYKWISTHPFTHIAWEKDLKWCTGDNEELFIADVDGFGFDAFICHDYKAGTEQIYFPLMGRTETTALTWCHTKSKIHIGDFNGDGHDDMLCHSDGGHVSVALADTDGLFLRVTWETAISYFCGPYEDLFHLHLGDFNGDGRTDLLCHLYGFETKDITLATQDGRFGPITSINMNWCTHKQAVLKVGYFNDDKKADLMCKDSSRLWLAMSE